ncbi:Uncharacterized protein C8035_v011226 [Colletotrichum spinosum]|uniref:Protein FAF1 n=1 Tax=Colletotrichum spinosum TaxID=1347390 RepID=A0A4R8PUG8_9PEZI|nr:Uncharacterized protein C8035_v011226 [Colletotrichum spinosum]
MASVLGKRKAPGAAAPAKKVAAAASPAARKTALKKRKPNAAAVPNATKERAPKPVEEEKRREDEEVVDQAVLDAQEVFRRHFEAAFGPLPDDGGKSEKKVRAGRGKLDESEDEGGEEDDTGDEDLEEDVGADGEEQSGEEWGGLSGDDEDEDDENTTNVVEVVDHSSAKPLPTSTMSKRELKAFMSSKPPSQTSPKPAPAAIDPAASDDENDKSHLANDLALQRLLSESHLLARHTRPNNPNLAPRPFAEGRLRQRQLDLRAQNLAASNSPFSSGQGVTSLFAQEKMPMAIRKGMNAAAAGRESKRRSQAKENGIVLEREAPSLKRAKRSSRGERSVDGPSVGRMKGAQLRLTERDVRSIEGPGSGAMRGGARRGGGRGGGRGGRGRR